MPGPPAVLRTSGTLLPPEEPTSQETARKPMSLYSDYLDEIALRKEEGLHAKPIDDAALV